MPLTILSAIDRMIGRLLGAYRVHAVDIVKGGDSRWRTDARQFEAGGRIDAWPAPLVWANSISCGLDLAQQISGIPVDALHLADVLCELT